VRPPDPPGAPFERSAGLDDPTGGGPFSLTSSGQTWCPRCYQSNMLEPVETPEVRPTVRTRVVEDTNAMDGVGGDAAEVSTLISKWDLVSVSKLEAGKKKDYVFKLGKDKRKRIDREEPVTDEPSMARPGSFTPQLRPDLIAQVEWLAENLDNPRCAVIDARTPDFYTGDRQSRANPRPGHIIGAENIPYPTVLDEETLTFKDDEALRSMFAEAGAEPGDTVITYCHIGQQASLVYYLAKSLGYDARMCDGSFEEWSQRGDLPVETTLSDEE